MLILGICLSICAVASTVLMMFIFVHSGNISQAEEARERKEKMNNLKTNIAKTENKDNE